MSVTSAQALKKYGEPGGSKEGTYMSVWKVPKDILDQFKHVKFSTLGTKGFPTKIYINNDFKPLLEKGLRNVIERGLTKELKTWDGVYIIRKKRLGSSHSLHSWGLAFDMNAFENGQGVKPKLSSEFVKCFTDAGMEWGGNWKGRMQDGMHMQIGKL